MDNTDDTPAFDEEATLQTIRTEHLNPPQPERSPVEQMQDAIWERQCQRGLKISTLPDKEQGYVRQALYGMPEGPERDAQEAKLVAKIISDRTQVQRMSRILSSLDNKRANEIAQINLDLDDMRRERDRLVEQMTEVARHDTVHDPKTGKSEAKPVLRLSASQIEQRGYRVAELDRNIARLESGPGWDERVGPAEKAELERRRDLHRRATIQKAAERRAQQILMDEEIEKLAKAKANARRSFN